MKPPKYLGAAASSLRFESPLAPNRGEASGVRGSFLILALPLFLSACSLGGSSPEPRLFTLASEAPPSAAASAAAYLVVIGPVTIPEVVDRPQIVTRAAGNRVELAENSRWAAPLKTEIPRVLADHIARLLPNARTATSDQRGAGAPDFRVLLDVQRFESSSDGATIQASWTIRPKEGAPVITGRSVLNEAAGAGYEAIVAAHSRALERLAGEIAAAIRARPAP